MDDGRKATEIKICGLKRLEDAQRALELGADYLGFVLYPRSPRCIEPSGLRALVLALPATARCVGVFVNVAPDEVARVVGECRLYAAQLHGDERADAFRDAPYRVWRALHVRDGEAQPDPADWSFAERFVVDAAPPGVYGGSGERADWAAAAQLAGRHKVMLAGGLTPDNVVAALRAVGPAGVDVSSGVEASPGVKDAAKMELMIRAVRGFGERK
jgi:phosphoribosylanthranilate isomerase